MYAPPATQSMGGFFDVWATVLPTKQDFLETDAINRTEHFRSNEINRGWI